MQPSKPSEWAESDWSGRWRIARRNWAKPTPQTRRLWLFSFGSGVALPLACAAAIVLWPERKPALLLGFLVAYLAVVIRLAARGIVVARRKR